MWYDAIKNRYVCPSEHTHVLAGNSVEHTPKENRDFLRRVTEHDSYALFLCVKVRWLIFYNQHYGLIIGKSNTYFEKNELSENEVS